MCIIQWLVSFIAFLKIGSISCQDVAFLDLGLLEGRLDGESGSIPSVHKYVDIYTNEPDVEKVLNSYKAINEQPKVQVKRKSDVVATKNVDRNNYDYYGHRNARPRFKTSRYSYAELAEASLPFTNIQKVPKKRPQVPEKTQASINEILKKYIAKLYAQKQNKHRQQRKQLHQNKKHQSKFLEEPLNALKNKTMKFANKFLSLFTVIEFPNSRCQATSASSVYEGTCYHRTECDNLNGTAIGQCANGYGVCCVCKY